MHTESQGWAGTLWVEGYPLLVTPETKLIAIDGSVFEGTQVETNMWASYQAARGSDGTITATRITFEPNRVDANEKSFRDGAEPVFVAADPAKHKPAQLKFGSQMPVTWELLLDQNLQDYVTRIGEALVPQYQKDLPDSDPAKIHFRFYVVKIASTWMGNMEDTVDLPNGIVLIQDNVLEELVDEAQLAAYISNSIAHVLEKQDYLHHGRLHGDKYGRLAGVAGTMTSTYLAPLSLAFGSDRDKLLEEINERCDRIGVNYMLQQGYDIREAPLAHFAQGADRVNNPLGPNQTPLERTDRLMQELQMDYSRVNYAALKSNREMYATMRAKAQAKTSRDEGRQTSIAK